MPFSVETLKLNLTVQILFVYTPCNHFSSARCTLMTRRTNGQNLLKKATVAHSSSSLSLPTSSHSTPSLPLRGAVAPTREEQQQALRQAACDCMSPLARPKSHARGATSSPRVQCISTRARRYFSDAPVCRCILRPLIPAACSQRHRRVHDTQRIGAEPRPGGVRASRSSKTLGPARPAPPGEAV